MGAEILTALAATIKARKSDDAGRSYTKQLLDSGIERCAKKLGEECTETVIAAVSQSDGELVAESADLIYHLLVVLECRNLSLDDVAAVLEQRMGTSGLAEKAARSKGKT